MVVSNPGLDFPSAIRAVNGVDGVGSETVVGVEPGVDGGNGMGG